MNSKHSIIVQLWSCLFLVSIDPTLWHTSYLYSIYIAFGTVSNLEVILKYEDVHGLHMHYYALLQKVLEHWWILVSLRLESVLLRVLTEWIYLHSLLVMKYVFKYKVQMK